MPSASSVPITPCSEPTKCFEEVLVALAAGAQHVLERQKNMLRGQFRGSSGSALANFRSPDFSRPAIASPGLSPLFARSRPRSIGVGLELRGVRAARPSVRPGRCSRSSDPDQAPGGASGDRISLDLQRLIAPLVGVGIEEAGAVHSAAGGRVQSSAKASGSQPVCGPQLSPGRHSATSRRPTGRRSRTSPGAR